MAKKNEVVNVESTKTKIENEKELSTRERVASYLTIHAAEHFAAACPDVELSDVEELLANTKKENGVHWVYTCPVIGGVNSKGVKNPTAEEWEKLNPDAVRADKLAGKQWYKKPRTIESALDIVIIASGWNRYNDAIDGAQKKVDSTLAAAAAIAGCTVEELKTRLGIK